MNCREAQLQIFAERDGALNNDSRAALNGHLAHCDACRRIHSDLAVGLTAWRNDVEHVAVPDAGREWHAVRRRMRGDAEASSRPRRNLFLWLALPLGAIGAAAVAVAFFIAPVAPPAGPSAATATPQVARADSVEAPGNNASTTVFVDDKSGWLIVWASDAAPKRG